MFGRRKNKEVLSVDKSENLNELQLLQKNGLININETRLAILKQKGMHLIENEKTITAISKCIPLGVKKASSMADAAKNSLVNVYTLPKGVDLANAKGENLYRGFVKSVEDGKIVEHAKFSKADPMEMKKAAHLASNILDVGSLVTGEMQMVEIRKELEAISDNVSNLTDILETEIESKILAMLPQVKEISDFTIESLRSDELRNRELIHLKGMLETSSQLLQQSNLRMNGIVKNAEKMSYKDYQKNVSRIMSLWEQQDILINVIKKISELRDVLGKGELSSEKCYFVYNDFLSQTNLVRKSVNKWHDSRISEFEINLDESKRKRKGPIQYIEKVKMLDSIKIPDSWKHVSVEDALQSKIIRQLDNNNLGRIEESVYNKEIQIAEHNGSYFYLTG